MHNANTIHNKADLIFNDLYARRMQRQSEVMNIKGLMKAKHELIIAAMPHHSIFIDKAEINYLLKKKLTKAETSLEFLNQKINSIQHSRKPEKEVPDEIN